MSMRMVSAFTVLACALAASQPVFAEIYRHRDANGNLVFTDQPPEDAEPVELGPINTVPAGPRPATRAAAPPPASATYTRLDIGGVQPGEVLQSPEGPVVISASADIPLQPGDSLVFFHNGRQVGEPGASSYRIDAIERGQHTLAAEIRARDGSVRIRSQPVTIQVHRHATPPAKVRPR